jgi:hypothetical protein
LKKSLIYFSIVACLVHWHQCAYSAQNKVILVEKNQPKAVILVRSDATWLETTAAENLAIYIAKSTNVYLNIKSFEEDGGSDLNQIRIGVAGAKPFENTQPGTIPYQGFKIISEGNRLDLIGSTMQGASNAVYWLLRNKLGVEWYMPTELGEEITITDRIALDEFAVVKEPSFICIRRATGRLPELERYGIRHYDTVRYVAPGAGNIDYGFNHNWFKIVPLTPENYYKHSEWFSLAKGRLVETAYKDLAEATRLVAKADSKYRERIHYAQLGLEYTDGNLAMFRYAANENYQAAIDQAVKLQEFIKATTAMSEPYPFASHPSSKHQSMVWANLESKINRYKKKLVEK